MIAESAITTLTTTAESQTRLVASRQVSFLVPEDHLRTPVDDALKEHGGKAPMRQKVTLFRKIF